MLVRSYGWDVTDNLTAITDFIDPARSQSFGYDGLYRLTFAQGVYGSHSYQYDALGNRTALTTDTASTSYAYATASNRLVSVDEGPGPVLIAYDPAGNTVDDGERQFSYNARNRLSEADGHQYGHNAQNLRVYKPRFGLAGDASGDGLITEADLTLLQQALNGQGTATLAMDCNQDGVVDNRDTPCIARQVGSNRNQGQGQGNGNGGGQGNGGGNGGPPPAPTTESVQVGWVLFTHDEQGRLIGEYDELGNPLRRYIWLNDMPVALIDADGIHFVHSDHLNTPQVVTDDTGTVVWAADYAPFGEVTERIAELEMNLRFPGQYLDRETGLHQNWHREYDPMTGRYTQSDPIGLRGGVNAYLYAGASPLSTIDANGQQAVDPDSDRHTQRNRNNRCPLNEPSPYDCEGNRWTFDGVGGFAFHGGLQGYNTYRRFDPANPGAGFQCTYDENSIVVTTGAYRGTYDYIAPDSRFGRDYLIYTYLAHRLYDVVPHTRNSDYEAPDRTEVYCADVICSAED